ncbi:hypothetical protein GPECTOR_31phG1 [Gonium pectorale]|uniref:Pherophorin domain-containing protein n=1 Tax=Gonium pectorale TaxID=33097 RepID=A0A150GDX5_GONPE|nr:hypothetical protein GPECTOR_31phG1 [Gonium pectorale]|eukprot:KXZ48042.1 hypothetical protein GPECTOR_31phG1 [Gonium pectorale]
MPTCASVSDTIISSINAAASAYGADIAVPFFLQTCSSTYDASVLPRVYPVVQVCGAFASDAAGAKLQDWLVSPLGGLASWTGSVRDGVCTGYKIVADIAAPGGGATCLAGQFEEACASNPDPTPPPPPPAGGLVQTHTCVQGNVNVPYSVGGFYTASTVDQGGYPAVAMCVKVAKQSCKASSYCCGMDFAKVEVPVEDACKSDLRRLTINGTPQFYSWGNYPQANGGTITALKFTSMLTNLPNPDGATLCWVVRPGDCADPARFCTNGRCQVSIFASNNKCCPATLVS